MFFSLNHVLVIAVKIIFNIYGLLYFVIICVILKEIRSLFFFQDLKIVYLIFFIIIVVFTYSFLFQADYIKFIQYSGCHSRCWGLRKNWEAKVPSSQNHLQILACTNEYWVTILLLFCVPLTYSQQYRLEIFYFNFILNVFGNVARYIFVNDCINKPLK